MRTVCPLDVGQLEFYALTAYNHKLGRRELRNRHVRVVSPVRIDCRLAVINSTVEVVSSSFSVISRGDLSIQGGSKFRVLPRGGFTVSHGNVSIDRKGGTLFWCRGELNISDVATLTLAGRVVRKRQSHLAFVAKAILRTRKYAPPQDFQGSDIYDLADWAIATHENGHTWEQQYGWWMASLLILGYESVSHLFDSADDIYAWLETVIPPRVDVDSETENLL
jgi:hypothetical protein